MKTVFAVDDSDTNLSMVIEALENHYRVMTMPSAAKMFTILEKITPDLVLLDIEMPEMNGFEALERLKSNESWAPIPVMFLTGRADAAVEAHGFELGAVDFVTKPFSAPVLLNRMKTHLDIDELIRERTTQIERLKNGIVFVLADMVENRDQGTGGHVERTTEYIRILINALMTQGVHADEMRDLNLESMVASARLHDIGKITIPDAILNKPGKLTDEEFQKMKSHCVEGERIIDQIVSRTGSVEFLRNAKMFAACHHERWDGKGYPNGLEGANIPIQGRVMAIVDVYDALVSERPYKKPFTEEEAIKIIMDGAGTQFDPEIANVFSGVSDQFGTIRREYMNKVSQNNS